MAQHRRKGLGRLAACFGLSLAMAAGTSVAEVRKNCQAIENDRMICTEVVTTPKPAQGKSPPTPAPPPWKAVVARAVLDGRCAEARRIALENGDLEAAQQAAALCVPR